MLTETSKKLAWFVMIFSAIIITASLVALCFGVETVGFLGVFMALPVGGLGFYNWKANNENKIKIPFYLEQEEKEDIDNEPKI